MDAIKAGDLKRASQSPSWQKNHNNNNNYRNEKDANKNKIQWECTNAQISKLLRPNWPRNMLFFVRNKLSKWEEKNKKANITAPVKVILFTPSHYTWSICAWVRKKAYNRASSRWHLLWRGKSTWYCFVLPLIHFMIFMTWKYRYKPISYWFLCFENRHYIQFA